MESDALRDELAQLHSSAFGWAMVCCGRDRDLAADVLQQTYCRILSGDASFAGQSEFSTWVFGVIRNIAREEYRCQQRRLQRYRFHSEITVQSCAAVDAGDVTVEQEELFEQLNSALEQLSDRQREVLHLTFYENMTIQQSAHILDIAVGSARQHYERGKASLRRIFSARRELEK